MNIRFLNGEKTVLMAYNKAVYFSAIINKET